MAIDNVTAFDLRLLRNPLRLHRFREDAGIAAAVGRSIVGRGREPDKVLFGEFSECFGHVQEPGLVGGVRDLLRQPHALRGISTVIDSGKKRQTTLPDAQR
jgi:hypothetical protein